MSHPVILKYPDQSHSLFGLYPSMHDSLCPSAWKDGRNVVYREQGVSRMEGWRRALSGSSAASVEIRGMGDLRRDSTAAPNRVLFYGTVGTDSARVFTWSPANLNGVTAYASDDITIGKSHQTSDSAAHAWTFAQTTDGRMMGATDNKGLLIWNSPGPFGSVEVSNQFATAKIVLAKGPFILAMNTTASGDADQSRAGKTTIHWSSRDAPAIWRPRAINSAGNIRASELDSQIIAAVPLGDRIAVYARDSMALLSFLGSPYYFGVQLALDAIGALSRHAVVSVGRYNYGLSKKGFWRTDGVEFQWIDTPAVREFYFSRVNRNADTKTFGYHNHKVQQVIWYFPSVSSSPPSISNVADLGLGFDYVRNVWTVYSNGVSFAIPERVFSRPLAGTSNGDIYYLNQGSDNLANTPINAYVETPKMDFGEPALAKSVQEVRLAVTDKSGTLNLHVRALNSMQESIAYRGPYRVTLGFNVIKVLETGRFFQAKLSSSSTANTWTVSSIEIRGRVAGVR